MLVLNGQYEVREPIGRGGMGVVYKAYDRKQKRHVAIKTIRDAPDRAAIQMFRKECGVLASLSHPNIVDIYDIGEFEESGENRPFFVMPLLPGFPLDKLIRDFSHRLTVERTVEIIVQTCKGLQAAHEKGVIHRDLKPSNIFVLADDAVKVIDFGVVHMVDSRHTMGHKGSLQYMAPEQLKAEPLSVRSDVFSLGVVCYEAFTRKRPFEFSKSDEIVQAILQKIPPPASEVNSAVNSALSRVVHKAIAKQPWSRFASAREFAEALQKALRNEPIEVFDVARIQPRINRARKAFDQLDYQFAGEILGELEAEGHLDPEISLLRNQIERAQRQKRIQQLLDSARNRFEEEEYLLALQKVQEVLEMDPENGAALGLKKGIETRRIERTIEEWLRLAHQHIENHAYRHAGQALRNVLQVQPQESRALQLLAEVEILEQEYLRQREEKVRFFDAAQQAWHNGEISTALSKMEMVLDLDHRAPDTTSAEQAAKFQSFYKQVRSEHDALKNAYAEASICLADHQFAKGRALCDEYLGKYPGYAPFQMLKFDLEEQQGQALSAFIAETDRSVEAEPDLDKRVSILKEAVGRYPGEAHFEGALRLARQKQELVNSIAAKAQYHEDRGQYTEALGQWEMLRTVYSQYPGLHFEIDRVIKRRDQQRSTEAKALRVQEVDRILAGGEYARAIQVLNNAKGEFPDDVELAQLEARALQGTDRAARINELVAQGKELCGRQKFEEGLEVLRQAFRIDSSNRLPKLELLGTLVGRARQLLDTDWHLADPLIDEALDVDPNHAQARSMRILISDRKRQQSVDACLSRARKLQAEGNIEDAKAEVERNLLAFPQDSRLVQLDATLRGELLQHEHERARRSDMEELRRLDRDSESVSDSVGVSRLTNRVHVIENRYSEDPEIQPIVRKVRRRLETWISHSHVWHEALNEVPARDGPSSSADLKRSNWFGARLRSMNVRAGRSFLGVRTRTRTKVEVARSWKTSSRRALLVGVLATVIVFAISAAMEKKRHQGVTHLPLTSVMVSTSPSGARIQVDGEDWGLSPKQCDLGEGDHRLDLQKAGYKPRSERLVVKRGGPAPPIVALLPWPLRIVVVTELSDPHILFDGQAPSKDTNDKKWEDDVNPGRHTLDVQSRNAQATVNFVANAGNMPTISDQHGSKNMELVTVSAFPGVARVEFSHDLAILKLDNRPDTGLKERSLDLTDIANGPHSLTWDDSGIQVVKNFNIGATPTLVVFLSPVIDTTKAAPTRKIIPPISQLESTKTAEVPQSNQTDNLYQRAYETYQNKDYADAVRYANNILQANPDYEPAKKLRKSSSDEEQHLIRDLLEKKDLPAARSRADALAELMPEDTEAVNLRKQVMVAEREEEARRHPLPPPKPFPIGQVTYVAGKKNYSGTLTVVSQHLKFAAKPIAGGEAPNPVDIPCSDIKEIKDKARIMRIGQKGVTVLTNSAKTFEFLSHDITSDAVMSACKKSLAQVLPLEPSIGDATSK